MIPQISDSMIAGATQSEKMLVAGRSYWSQGRVDALEIHKRKGIVTARVRGSARHPYSVTIIFSKDAPDDYYIDVDCNCPVGDGCKHGAAVLFAAQSLSGQASGGLLMLPERSPSAPPARVAPLPVPLLNWLSETQAKAQKLVGQADLLKLAYVFTPRALHAGKVGKAGSGSPPSEPLPHQLAVHPWLEELAVAGNRKWSQISSYGLYRALLTHDPLDQWLLRRMGHHNGDFDGAGSPHGIGGADWLNKAIAAGRAHWRKPDGPLLYMAPAHSARFQWATQADGSQRLTLDGLPDDVTLLALAPPLLVDGRTGAVYPVETGIEADHAQQLLLMPPVPPHAVPVLSAQWAGIAGSEVEPPSLSKLVDRGIVAPTPVLSFREEGLDIRTPPRGRHYSKGTIKQGTALARLSFDYDGCTVTPATEATLIFAPTADGVVRFQRDLLAETRAFERLAETTMLPLAAFGEIKLKPSQDWDFILHPGARPADYGLVLQEDVPRLREQGWRIDYAAKWSLNIVEVDGGSLSFDVNPSGMDWFDISLGARIDGKVVDILPMLRRLLAAHGAALLDHPGTVLSLPLAPGKLAQIPLEKLKPVLATLLQLALHDSLAEGRLRLPARDLATLADLESATQSQISWSGAEPLRQLAQALTRLRIEPTILPDSFTATLRPYQQQGLDWLQALYKAGFGGVLADDMGLGKTVQALAHLAALKANGELAAPALIICPTSVLPNWQAELKQFAPDLCCLLWHGSDRRALRPDIAGHDVLLTSYPLLARDHADLASQAFGLVIFDEAHMLKNSKTAGFKAARKIQGRQVIALTGTPVENQLADAWSLTELVTPGLLGPLDRFTRDFARPIARDNDAVAKASLVRRLRPFLLRRTKDEVARDLPAKTEIPEWIDLEAGQLALYESVRLLMHKRVPQSH